MRWRPRAGRRALSRQPRPRRPLRKVIDALAQRTGKLLEQSRPFAGDIADRRLALEVGVIQALAERSRRSPDAPRSAVGARPSSSRRGGRRWRCAALSASPGSSAGWAAASNPGWTTGGMTIEPQAEADPTALQAQVSGSSFYAAMRVMPKAERAAMFAIYSFCRMVDDIADDGTRPRPRARRRARPRGATISTRSMPADRPAAPHSCKDAVRDFGLRQADFLAVIDGMEMDVAADIRAPDLATLDLYCDRVAGAVGRLSIAHLRHGGGARARARASAGPRPAAHQHPARPRRGCRDRPPVPAA